MNQYNNQGKGHKVAATQETTAQNAEIQSYFNGINQEQLNAVCEVLSTAYSRPGGLQFNPSYFQNYLEMANKFIQGARMGEDKRNMVLNAFHFVCDALLNTQQDNKEYEHYDYIAQSYYAEDLEDLTFGEDEEFEDKEDLQRSVEYEIGCILTDWDYTSDDFNYDPEDWEWVSEIIQAYIDVLDEYECEVADWIYEGFEDRNNHFAE
jgi:hypothetical protein